MNGSVNSVVGFRLTAKHCHVVSTSIGASLVRSNHFILSSENSERKRCRKGKRWRLCLSVADGDYAKTDTPDKSSPDNARSIPNIRFKAANLPSDSSPRDNPAQTGTEINLASSDLEQNASSGSAKSTMRSPSTAREKLRAARVLSRYTESKASKLELGSKVLEAIRESDRGKRRSGLPEAPTNLFDDSKRGLPKPGWTFEFPGGFDVFVIAFSFVFITTVMLATTYIVWKAGAIHFDEY